MKISYAGVTFPVNFRPKAINFTVKKALVKEFPFLELLQTSVKKPLMISRYIGRYFLPKEINLEAAIQRSS